MRCQIAQIEVKDRDRKEFTNIEKLVQSLKQYGQIQPIVVTESQSENYKYRLVVGGRRLQASMLAGFKDIEIVLKSQLQEIKLKEMELEENVQRSDLIWSELIAAKLRLDELKKERYGEAVGSKKPGEREEWSTKKTAKLIGEAVGGTSQDLELARAMRGNAKLATFLKKFPKTTAFKKLKEIRRHKEMKDLVERREITISTDFRCGSCLDFLPLLEEKSIHAIITDPPFGVEGIEHHKIKTRSDKKADRSTDNMTKDEVIDLYVKMIPELSRVIVDGGFFFIFFGIDLYDVLRITLEANGFHVNPVPLIWDKECTTSPFFGYSFQDCYEPIMYGYKEPRSRQLFKPMRNIVRCKPVSTRIKTHSFEKPVPLLKVLIEQATATGEVVLDPCAGTAATLVASLKIQRRAIGFELNDKNFLNGYKRIAEMEESL